MLYFNESTPIGTTVACVKVLVTAVASGTFRAHHVSATWPGSYGLNASMQFAQTEKAGSFGIGESNLDEDVGRD